MIILRSSTRRLCKLANLLERANSLQLKMELRNRWVETMPEIADIQGEVKSHSFILPPFHDIGKKTKSNYFE